MGVNSAPEWGWEGHYDCPDCGETFLFMREDGWEAMQGWTLQVYHSHNDPDHPEGVWVAAAYREWKGRRKPPIVKEKEVQRQAAHKREREERQVANASR